MIHLPSLRDCRDFYWGFVCHEFSDVIANIKPFDFVSVPGREVLNTIKRRKKPFETILCTSLCINCQRKKFPPSRIWTSDLEMSVSILNLQSPALPTELSADAVDFGKHKSVWPYIKPIPLVFPIWLKYVARISFIFKLLTYEVNRPIFVMRACRMIHSYFYVLTQTYRFRKVVWGIGHVGRVFCQRTGGSYHIRARS